MKQTHLCRYDTLPVLVEDDRRPRSSSAKLLDPFSIRKPRHAGDNGMEFGHQTKLQMQQQQFQQELLQKQQYQHSLQAQMAAKYAQSAAVGASAMPIEYQNQMQMPGYVPVVQYKPPPMSSYNMEHNLKNEYEQLKERMGQIEVQFPGFKQEHAVQAIPNHNSFVTDSSRNSTAVTIATDDKSANTGNTSISLQSDEDHNTNIDPMFFQDGEYLKINTVDVLGNYLEFEPGLFTGFGILKNDQYFALVYLNVMSKFGAVSESFEAIKAANGNKRRVNKRDTHMFALLENENYQLEDMIAMENINLLSTIKAIEKVQISGLSRKLFWMLIEKFFEKFDKEVLPLRIDQVVFLKEIENFMGEREDTDQKIKVNVDLKKNQDIINFTLVTFILRVFQLSLKCTSRLDKETSHTFKSLLNEPGNEVELHFQVLLLLLERVDLNNDQRLKLHIVQEFLIKHSFEPIQQPPLQVEKLIVGQLLDNDADVRAFCAKEYISQNTMNGTQFLLSVDHFQLSESNVKDLFSINSQILERLNTTAVKPTHLSTMERFLYDLHELLTRNNLHFNDFKTDSKISTSKKVTLTVVSLEQLYLQMNVVGLISLQFDKQDKVDQGKFFSKIICLFDLIHQSNAVILDILKNYNSYYHPGFEFLLANTIVKVLSTNFNLLLSYLLRFHQSNHCEKLALHILKHLYLMTEELHNHSILKNHYGTWKIVNRLKCLLYLFKTDEEIFNTDDVSDFSKSQLLISGLLKNEQFEIIEKKLQALNDGFSESEVMKIGNVKEFLETVKFAEEPVLSLNFMY
ncbi:hypothetical protein WICPIJ_000351 [Wickerhamomyces pijperi]|uniref:Uncharacterized protein n=1 Tax=Wickerhamomyces pijperi TaxID=599730 RepID=A0A9P8QGW4_WICPI|nr:hypothetical protein WICPIJ_000351 [Wickerhamomyces pijperi]